MHLSLVIFISLTIPINILLTYHQLNSVRVEHHLETLMVLWVQAGLAAAFHETKPPDFVGYLKLHSWSMVEIQN